MTKRGFLFGDRYVVKQMRLGRYFVVFYETGEMGIHVPACQPLLVEDRHG